MQTKIIPPQLVFYCFLQVKCTKEQMERGEEQILEFPHFPPFPGSVVEYRP